MNDADDLTGDVLAWGVPRLRDLPWRHTRDPWAVLVSEVSTQSREIVIDQVDGVRSITLEIDALPLVEGTYDLTCAVVDETGHREYDVRNRFVRFDVLRGASSDRGLVSLGGSWNVHGQQVG